MNNLWEQAQSKCLVKATELLDGEVTKEKAEMATGLISAAVSIEALNLQWAAQSRYGEQVFRGRPSSRTVKGKRGDIDVAMA